MPDLGSAPLIERVRSAVGAGYRIERELGRGGMAVVFLGRDQRHGRDVAVKVLRPEIVGALSPERFLREIRIAAQLQHPLILPLFDSGESGGLFYYVMPFVAGESLRDRLSREQRIPVTEAATIGREIAEALHYAHERGFVHRDIKPENILLSGGHPLVADFGIARALGESQGTQLTATGVMIGTPHYMSPEQALGDANVDRRSDIYSLACVVYEMLTGAPPYPGGGFHAIVAGHIQAPVPDTSKVTKEVPRRLSDAISVGLAKNPDDRYQTARQFAAALAGEVTGFRPRPNRSNRLRVGLTLAAGVALAIGGFSIWRGVRPQPKLNPDLVAIVPFSAGKGLEAWGDGAMEDLARNLNGAGPLRTVSPSEIRPSWVGPADPRTAGTAARRTEAGLVVFGAVVKSGADSVRLTATARDVNAGANLAEIEVSGRADRRDLVTDSATVALINGLSQTRAIGAVKGATARSRSLPALKAYLQGEQFYRRAVWDSALGYYQRAVAIDTGFVQALHRIFQTRRVQGTGNDSLVWAYARRAGGLNRGLGLRDSLVLAADATFANFVYGLVSDSGQPPAIPGVIAAYDQAAQRFPDDPEIWYQLGVVRRDLGRQLGVGSKEILEAIDRSISLDSAFVPAYVFAIPHVLGVRGEDTARQFLTRYLALQPLGAAADGARLVGYLLDPRSGRSTEAGRMLDTASVLTLFEAQRAFFMWPDSAETYTELARRLVARPRDPHLAEDPGMARLLLGRALAWRGRLAEAGEYQEGYDLQYSNAVLALLSPSPPRQGSGRFQVGPADGRPSPRQGLALPWWATHRDSVSLLRTATSTGRSHEDWPARYLQGAAGAYLALIRSDSAGALARFLALPALPPDALFGDIDRLVTVQLLRLAGRLEEARTRIEAEPRTIYPLDAAWLMERGRVNEQLGRPADALVAYQAVVAILIHADSLFQPIVAEAKTALRRLGPPTR